MPPSARFSLPCRVTRLPPFLTGSIKGEVLKAVVPEGLPRKVTPFSPLAFPPQTTCQNRPPRGAWSSAGTPPVLKRGAPTQRRSPGYHFATWHGRLTETAMRMPSSWICEKPRRLGCQRQGFMASRGMASISQTSSWMIGTLPTVQPGLGFLPKGHQVSGL